MKTISLVVALIFWSGLAPAMSFWTALAEIESGGNDYAIGSVGEVSRYQIRPEVWRAYSSSRRYHDPAVALPIAEKYMAKLKRDFERATGRAATESDCVILWKSGISGYEKQGFNPARMSAAHQDRIIRFRNLRNEELTMARVPAQRPAARAVLHDAQKPADTNEVATFLLGSPANGKAAFATLVSSGAANQPVEAGGLFSGVETPPDIVRQLTLCLR